MTELIPFDQRLQLSKVLAESSMLPKQYGKNPANVLLAIEYAKGLGLDTGLALHVMDVIDGTPDLSSSTLAGMVRRAGHRLRISGDEFQATCQIIRADDPDFVYQVTWTIEMADRAGLTRKDNWRNYPAAMLQARAIKACAKQACSELLLGPAPTPPPAQPWPTDTTTTVTVEPITEPTPDVDTYTGEIAMATQPQIDQIRQLGAELGVEDMRTEIANLLGHPLGQPTDLTREEAHMIIDHLTSLPQPAEIVEEEEPHHD